jgi:hypothetical protein
MPRKRTSDSDGDSLRLGKVEQVKVQNAIMLWLATPLHRNIVMGSSGSAQNQGGMAGRAVVVPKTSGFVMLAKFIEQMCAVKVTSDQAEGKFRYMLSKFTKANAYSKLSSCGVDESDFAKGIRSIPQKLDAMCPQYEVWESYFGHLQKFNPSSVISSASEFDLDHSEEENEKADGNDDADIIEAEVERGDDGRIDVLVLDEDKELAVAGTEAEAAKNTHAAAPLDAEGVGDIHPVAPVSPGAFAFPGFASSGARARGRGGNGAAPKVHKSSASTGQQLADAKSALDAVVSCAPLSGSSTPRNSSSNSFESTYASVKTSVSRDQIASQTTISREQLANSSKIEEAKLRNSQEIQRRDHEFQAQMNIINVLAAERREKEERRVKQKIEFQNNVTQLLLKDQTGDLAKKLVDTTQQNAHSFEDAREDNFMQQLLSQLMSRYAAPAAPS